MASRESVKQESERMIEDAPPNSFTHILDSGIKATFTDGLVPTEIQFLEDLHPQLRVKSVVSGLEVTWSQPHHSIWLNCGTLERANLALQALRGQVVHGVSLKCSIQRRRSDTRPRVFLHNVPESVRTADLFALLPQGFGQPGVRQGKPSYDPLLHSLGVIKKWVSRFTPRKVVSSEMLACENKSQRKGLIKFDGSPNLASISHSMNNTFLHELGGLRMFASEHLQVVLNVKYDCFRKHSSALEEIASRARIGHCVHISFDAPYLLSPYRPPHVATLPVEISIVSQSREQLTKVKAEIDRVFIESTDSLLQQLQPSPRLPSHLIELTYTSDFKRATRGGGIAAAQRLLGDETVRLEDNLDPPAVVVRGDYSVLCRVLKIMWPDRPPLPTDCEICLDKEAATIHIPSCSHICCKDCFEGYCTNAMVEQFPFRCFGAECNAFLDLQLIRQNVDHGTIKSILDRAMTAHLGTHTKDYARCPSLDCGTYYKLDTGETERICTTCFTIICINCKVEQHFGETCAEYLKRHEGNLLALERWMRKGGAKRCPSCSTIIEKSAGCNNMTCGGCQANICFGCMEVFPTHKSVYEHMLEVHGSYGDQALDFEAGLIDEFDEEFDEQLSEEDDEDSNEEFNDEFDEVFDDSEEDEVDNLPWNHDWDSPDPVMLERARIGIAQRLAAEREGALQAGERILVWEDVKD